MSTSNEKPSPSEAEHQPTATFSPIGEDASAEEDDERKSLEGLSVLLVEDQLILRAIGVKMLKALGATVTAADNGAKAVQAITCMLSAGKARKQAQAKGQEGSSSQTSVVPHYDLILMDCNMPVMDGYEATKEIRKLESEANDKDGILIVAFTSNAPDIGLKECIAAGMDAFMQKPVQEEEMASSILVALSDKRNKVNKVTIEEVAVEKKD